MTLATGATGTIDASDYFTDPDGDMLTYTARSSDTGVARVSVSGSTVTIRGVAAGSATITITARDPGGLAATQRASVTVTSGGGAFDFEMRFTSAVSGTVRSRLEEARDEWELVLKDTELSDIRVNRTLRCGGVSGYVGTVDDHLLFAHVDSIDGERGILAYARYCYQRTSDGSPVLSRVVFDEDDIEEMMDEDALVPTAFHEMAHALGFPGYWFYRDLVDTLDADDPHFEGGLAIKAFNEAGGVDYLGEKVPIELELFAHWRESVFGDEIMTPFVNLGVDRELVSAITLQSMADVGYKVDVSRADDYELPSNANRVAGEAVFDLSHDVEWGPVIVLDADGRVDRVIPPPPGTVVPSFPWREVRIEPGRPPGPGNAPSGSDRPPPPPPEEAHIIKARRPPGTGSGPSGSGSRSR